MGNVQAYKATFRRAEDNINVPVQVLSVTELGAFMQPYWFS